jgi:hypothetical protein
MDMQQIIEVVQVLRDAHDGARMRAERRRANP